MCVAKKKKINKITGQICVCNGHEEGPSDDQQPEIKIKRESCKIISVF